MTTKGTRMPETFVIVGAGLAGAKAAEALREEGFDGRIVLIGEEAERPYERPPLSKDYLRGEAARDAGLRAREGFYAEHDIELRTGTRSTALDAGAREVVLAGGERLGYDRLLLATGAEPRRLRCRARTSTASTTCARSPTATRSRRARAGRPRRRRRRRLDRREVAASARQSGSRSRSRAEPRAARARARPRGRRDLPRPAPRARRPAPARHRRRGDRGGRARRARAPDDGRALDVDRSSSASASRRAPSSPRRRARRSTTAILVDAACRPAPPASSPRATSPTPSIRFYGRAARRALGQRADQGPAPRATCSAEAVAYDRSRTSSPTSTTSAWSTRARAPDYDEVVFRGDPATREFIAFWLRDGRVVAGMNVNVWDVTDDIQALGAMDHHGRRGAPGDLHVPRTASGPPSHPSPTPPRLRTCPPGLPVLGGATRACAEAPSLTGRPSCPPSARRSVPCRTSRRTSCAGP